MRIIVTGIAPSSYNDEYLWIPTSQLDELCGNMANCHIVIRDIVTNKQTVAIAKRSHNNECKLSRLSAHRLGFHCQHSVSNVAVTVEFCDQNRSQVAISELCLHHIQGLEYPSIDRENMLLHDHFLTAQLVSEGGILEIAGDFKNAEEILDSITKLSFGGHVTTSHSYSHVYAVGNIKCVNDRECHDLFVTSPKSTAVALSNISLPMQLHSQQTPPIISSQSNIRFLHLCKAFESSFGVQTRQKCQLVSTYQHSPLIVQSSRISELGVDALKACKLFGIGLHQVDCRQLFSWKSANMSISANAESRNNREHVFVASDCSVAFALLQAPCVLMICGIDEFIAQGQKSSGEAPAEDISSTLATLLNNYFREIWQASELKMKVVSETINRRWITEVCNHSVYVIAGTSGLQELKPCLRAIFPNEYRDEASTKFELPTTRELSFDDGAHKLMETSCASMGGSAAVCVSVLASCHRAAVTRSRQSQWLQNCGLDASATEVCMPPFNNDTLTITAQDVKSAVHEVKLLEAAISPSKVKASASNISAVHWADIGGLDRVRQEILDVLQLPLLHPEMFAAGCPVRRGVLLYGPPGTGKTLVAKAVATECDMSFLSVKGPELLDVYVGESERNVREIFNQARSLGSTGNGCVIFFDELDSLAPARGRGGDAGGVMDRVVSQLLTEMDSLSVPLKTGTETGSDNGPQSGSGGVFVIGATNRPDLLDPALLRPGRFDRRVYLSVCKDPGARAQIIRAQTRKFALDNDVQSDFLEIAAALPVTMTGADISAVCSRAYQLALTRKISQLSDELSLTSKILSPSHQQIAAHMNRLPEQQLSVVVCTNDFLTASLGIKPSVTLHDIEHYDQLDKQFS